MPTAAIVLVEDNADDVHLMSEAIAGVDQGIHVTTAASVAAAKTMLSDLPYPHLPTLVVTDHHLSDQRGQDLIAHLRASPTGHHLPVVMVSGDSQRPADIGEISWFGKPDTWEGWRTLAQELVRRVSG